MKWTILTLAFVTAVFAAQNDSVVKKYIDVDEVAIAKDGIYVLLQSEWTKVPSLNHDAGGFYIRTQAWQCPVCYNWNWDSVKNCEDCSYGR